MSIVLLLARLFKAVPAILRTLAEHRHMKLGKELARGKIAKRQMERLEKATQARRRAGIDAFASDRLHDNDGYRRD